MLVRVTITGICAECTQPARAAADDQVDATLQRCAFNGRSELVVVVLVDRVTVAAVDVIHAEGGRPAVSGCG